MAENFAKFLIGDAELPEVTDDNAHIKELLEIANKIFDNSRKCNNDKIDCMFKGGSTDLGETIYKLDGSNIDYEERRYEIAKSVLPKMLDWLTVSGTISQDAIEDNRATRNAVFFADALIAELKKTNETK